MAATVSYHDSVTCTRAVTLRVQKSHHSLQLCCYFIKMALHFLQVLFNLNPSIISRAAKHLPSTQNKTNIVFGGQISSTHPKSTDIYNRIKHEQIKKTLDLEKCVY